MAKQNSQHIKFVGRDFKTSQMRRIAEQHEASILRVYVRRRVGKTTMTKREFAKRYTNPYSVDSSGNTSSSSCATLTMR